MDPSTGILFISPLCICIAPKHSFCRLSNPSIYLKRFNFNKICLFSGRTCVSGTPSCTTSTGTWLPATRSAATTTQNWWTLSNKSIKSFRKLPDSEVTTGRIRIMDIEIVRYPNNIIFKSKHGSSDGRAGYLRSKSPGLKPCLDPMRPASKLKSY